MRLVIQENYDNVSNWAAKYVRNRIQEFHPGPNTYFVLGLPTGLWKVTYWVNFDNRVFVFVMVSVCDGLLPEGHSEPSQASPNGWKSLTVVAKDSIVDVYLRSDCTSGFPTMVIWLCFSNVFSIVFQCFNILLVVMAIMAAFDSLLQQCFCGCVLV